jgi:hypothetical protein
MRNFFFEDSGSEDEYRDSYHEGEEESMEASFMIPAQIEFMHMAQLDLASVDLNQKLLAESIKMLERSWFWRFYSLETKLVKIRKTYEDLTRLMEEVAKDDSKDEE